MVAVKEILHQASILKSFLTQQKPKERGHYCMSYTYVTVFIRNAANLTHLLTKGPKFRNGNENFDIGLKSPF
jgi:hypothetical protein